MKVESDASCGVLHESCGNSLSLVAFEAPSKVFDVSYTHIAQGPEVSVDDRVMRSAVIWLCYP